MQQRHSEATSQFSAKGPAALARAPCATARTSCSHHTRLLPPSGQMIKMQLQEEKYSSHLRAPQTAATTFSLVSLQNLFIYLIWMPRVLQIWFIYVCFWCHQTSFLFSAVSCLSTMILKVVSSPSGAGHRESCRGADLWPPVFTPTNLNVTPFCFAPGNMNVIYDNSRSVPSPPNNGGCEEKTQPYPVGVECLRTGKPSGTREAARGRSSQPGNSMKWTQKTEIAALS